MIVQSYEDVVVLSGNLNANYWETIHTAISLTLRRHPTGVIVDCSGLSSANSQGAVTFQEALDFVTEHPKARIILTSVPDNVLAVLKEISEVRSQLPIVRTIEEARASLDLLSEGDDHGGKKRKEVKKKTDINVIAVLQGSESDVDVIVVTRELVNNISARVTILLPIVVPRDLPISAPLPEMEASLARSAEHAADTMVGCETPHETRLERTRDLPSLIFEMSESESAAYTVVAIPHDSAGSEVGVKLVRGLLEKVKRPLLMVRGQVP